VTRSTLGLAIRGGPYTESFHGELREECLNQYLLLGVWEG